MQTDSPRILQTPISTKWITSVDQASDHAQQTLLTRSHDVIVDWARRRHAEPSTGKGKLDVRDGGSGLRFDFPGMGRLRPLAWDEWFAEFESYGLVFAFREQFENGQPSTEYRIVNAEQLKALGIEPLPDAE